MKYQAEEARKVFGSRMLDHPEIEKQRQIPQFLQLRSR